MSRTQTAEKILEYWFALEFLSQDKYPDYRNTKNKIDKHKKKVINKTAKNKSIGDFILLTNKDIKKIFTK